MDCRRRRAVGDDRQLVQEPRVDTGRGRQRVGSHPAAQRRLELEHASGRGRARRRHELVVVEEVVGHLGGIAVEPGPPLLERADGLLERLGEGPPDGHDLPHRLHAGTEPFDRAGQLLEGPTRDLGDDVVDGGLEARRRGAGDVVGDLVERVSDGQARRDLGDGEPGRLGCQGRRARHARVHLDHEPPAVGGAHRELDVRSARLDPDAPDAGEGVVAHRLVFDVRQRLRGGDGDRVAGVHTHGVEVLDRAHHDAVVHPVAHDLELELLPSRDGPLDQDLVHRARRQPLGRHLGELDAVIGGPGPGSSQDEAGPDHERKADALAERHGLVEVRGEPRGRNLEPDLLHGGLELVAVLGGGDRLGVGADQLDAERVEHAPFRQPEGEVEAGLAPHGGQQGVGSLPLDHRGEHVEVEGLHVGPVGDGRVGHDRGRIRVDEHDPVPLGPQHAARLGARVVELARLADHDRARADDEDGLDVGTTRHQTRHLVDHAAEPLEQVAGVVRSGTRLGVVLHAEGGSCGAPEPLDDTVVEVDVGDLGRERSRVGRRAAVDGVVVVLAGDLDLAGVEPAHGMVAPVVPEGELVGPGPDGLGEELVTEADPEHRAPARAVRR